MEKSKKYFIFGGIVVLIVLILIVVASLTGKKKDANVANTDQTGNSALPVLGTANPLAPAVATSAPQLVPMPTYTKKVKLEMMGDAEKKKLGIDPSSLIQVLQRDASGAVTAYKPLQSASDAMEYYGN